MGEEKKKDDPKYDAGYKHELSKKKQFIHFMQKYVKAQWCRDLKPEQVELCDREFLLEDYQKRMADLVYRIRLQGREFYVYLIMELQSSVDHTMPFRLLTLIFALQLKIFLETPVEEREKAGYRLPVIIPVVFYNGQNRWTAQREYRKYQKGYEMFGKFVLNFQYYVVDLKRIRNKYILNSNTLIDNILALDRNRENQQLAGILEEIAKRLEELDGNDKVDFRKWLEHILVAAAKGSNRKAVYQLLDAMQKGDVHMIHGLQLTLMELLDENSETNRQAVNKEVKRVIGKAVEKAVKKAVKEAEKEAIEVGKKRGLEIGEKRGLEIGEKRGLEIGEKRGLEIGEKRGLEIGEKRGLEIGEKRGFEIGEKRGLETKGMHCYLNAIARGMTHEDAIAIADITEEEAMKALSLRTEGKL